MSVWQKVSVASLSIFWFALLGFGLLGLAVVHVLPWWVVLALVAVGALLGAAPFALRWLFKRSDPYWNGTLSYFSFALVGVLAIFGLAGLPVFYFAYWVDSGPTNIPLATFSNGKKTVVFQGMQHIGSEGFYKGVVFDLEKALADGYTLFYEGVQDTPGRPDANTWFNQDFLGHKTDLSTGYKTLADRCGLTFQLTYFDPLLADKAIHPKKHVTADVSTLDMRNEYDRLLREDPSFAEAQKLPRSASDTSADPLSKMLALVDGASPAQRRLIGYLCRGVIAKAMAGPAETDPRQQKKIILTFRNKALAKFVAESPASKIYITYGAAHLKGFVEDLRALDPGFQLVSINWNRAMSNPRDADPPDESLALGAKR